MNPTRKQMWTDAEVNKIVAESLDTEKVHLICGEHKYVAGPMPPIPRGCKQCALAWWWYIITSTPPHLREERLEQAHRAVYDAVKMAERGEFDIELYEHPELEIKRDQSPEEIEKEKEN